VGHMTAPELPSQGGWAWSHGTRDSAIAHLSKEARSEATAHVAAPELPSQGGEVRGHGTHGGAGTHLCREVRSGDGGHGAALELTSTRRQGPGSRDTWRHRSPPLQGGVVQRYSLRDSA
jgi:hypothetical protein